MPRKRNWTIVILSTSKPGLTLDQLLHAKSRPTPSQVVASSLETVERSRHLGPSPCTVTRTTNQDGKEVFYLFDTEEDELDYNHLKAAVVIISERTFGIWASHEVYLNHIRPFIRMLVKDPAFVIDPYLPTLP
jgi:hypothetical protein